MRLSSFACRRRVRVLAWAPRSSTPGDTTQGEPRDAGRPDGEPGGAAGARRRRRGGGGGGGRVRGAAAVGVAVGVAVAVGTVLAAALVAPAAAALPTSETWAAELAV